MSLKGQNVLITGASMGIGAAVATQCAQAGANLILVARSVDKLEALAAEIKSTSTEHTPKILTLHADVSDYKSISSAVTSAVSSLGPITTLVNNAGLALGAPSAFPELSIDDIVTMTGTNINGFMFATYAALNAGGMRARAAGTILNITSVTGLEVPPFPGEAVYHASKATQEAFTNVLRTELTGTEIKVLALRPGVVATHFHTQRVGFDMGQYDDFMDGFEPLEAKDVAECAVFMLGMKDRVSVKALDVVPTAQRSLQVFDREWNERRGMKGGEGS